MKFPTIAGWLQWLESAHARPIDLGLERIASVAERLGVNGSLGCPTVTVGGTNGKGSTVAFLTAMLRAAGYKVGTYTSPHLQLFNERIAINGEPVSDAVLLAAFEAVEAERQEVSLTYFEFTTLAAFVVFRDAKLDAAVLEVGLGGRLDAVNLIDADVAVVTSVGIDHVDFLGPDRERIGFEKAGIFRAGRPAICGDREPPAALVAHAEALRAVLQVRGREFDVELHPGGWSWWRHDGLVLTELPLPYLALDNATSALAALQCLPLEVPEWAVREGLRSATLPGRFEVYWIDGVRVVLDVAHNPHGAEFLMRRLGETATGGRLHAVFAMLGDKDAAGVLEACLGHVDAWYVTALTGPRARPAAALAEMVRQAGGYVAATTATVIEALRLARQAAAPGDTILVFGSFYTVGAVQAALRFDGG